MPPLLALSWQGGARAFVVCRLFFPAAERAARKESGARDPPPSFHSTSPTPQLSSTRSNCCFYKEREEGEKASNVGEQ